MAMIAKALANRPLHVLNLHLTGNACNSATTQLFFQAIRANPYVRELSFGSHQLGRDELSLLHLLLGKLSYMMSFFSIVGVTLSVSLFAAYGPQAQASA